MCTSHRTHCRSHRGRDFTGQMTQPTVSKHWKKDVLRIRLQSHQVHPAMLIIMQHTQYETKTHKYTLNLAQSINTVCGLEAVRVASELHECWLRQHVAAHTVYTDVALFYWPLLSLTVVTPLVVNNRSLYELLHGHIVACLSDPCSTTKGSGHLYYWITLAHVSGVARNLQHRAWVIKQLPLHFTVP